MPRPKGAKNKKTIEREKARAALKKKLESRSDTDIVDDIKERFDIYFDMIKGAYSDGKALIQSLIVSGAAGVGKSYTAEWALDGARHAADIRYKIVRGAISPIDLYELAYDLRNPRSVIVLDDADMIFDDEVGLNILKSLLDTSAERKVNWMTDHPRFKGDSALPKEFTFGGAMIFLTNKNFQEYIDRGVGKHVPHMEALMSRSIYLDLKMHSRREVALWAKHLVIRNRILQETVGTNITEEEFLMEWLMKHMDDLREMSIRTAIKLGRIYKMNPAKWESRAKALLLREGI